MSRTITRPLSITGAAISWDRAGVAAARQAQNKVFFMMTVLEIWSKL
jgi:hypothetical protein